MGRGAALRKKKIEITVVSVVAYCLTSRLCGRNTPACRGVLKLHNGLCSRQGWREKSEDY
jgi:hypothetical protein